MLAPAMATGCFSMKLTTSSMLFPEPMTTVLWPLYEQLYHTGGSLKLMKQAVVVVANIMALYKSLPLMVVDRHEVQ